MTGEIVLGLLQRGVQLWVDDGGLRWRAPEEAVLPEQAAEALCDKDGALAAFVGEDRKLADTCFLQQELWLAEQLHSPSQIFFLQAVHRVRGPLDPALIETALAVLMDRHEILRTRFELIKGHPVQSILKRAPELAVTSEDFAHLGAAAFREATSWITARGREPFDFSRAPMIRFFVARLGKNDHLAALGVHHIIIDGVRYFALFQELAAVCRALAAGTPLPQPAVPQYADFAALYNRYIKTDTDDTAYWRERLRNLPPRAYSFTDAPKRGKPRGTNASIALPLDPGLIEGVARFAKEVRAHPFIVYLTALQALATAYEGQPFTAIGTPVVCRRAGRGLDRYGTFASGLCLPVDFSSAPSFREAALLCRDTFKQDVRHGDMPIRALAHRGLLQLAPNTTPYVFSVTLIPGAGFREGFPGCTHEVLREFDEQGASNPCHLCLLQDDAGITAMAVYDPGLLSEADVRRIARHYFQLIEAATAAPDRCVWDFPVVTPGEQRQIDAWNATARDWDLDRPVHRLIEAQADQTPDAPAVSFEDETLSYAGLDTRANRLAHVLQALGAAPETLIGISLERGLDLPAAVLAVWKTGAAFLPLDPGYPESRLRFMVEDAGVQTIVTTSDIAPRFAGMPPRLFCLDGETAALAQASESRPSSQASGDSLAYCIYTSGSTGQPKGVLAEHRSAVNLAHWQKDFYGLEPEDCILQFAAFSFDAFVSEYLMALACGGELRFAQREDLLDPVRLEAIARGHGVTVLTLVPTMWREVSDSLIAALRVVLTAGEACGAALAQRLCKAGHAYNAYGPTEAAVCAAAIELSCGMFEETQGQAPPIGFPVANAELHVLDPHNRTCPIGVPGELCIGGAGVARGYLGRPEDAAERFIANPFGPGRLYRTGDQARRLESGAVEFLGRLDGQVKVRGQRIETGEVEACLRRHTAVREAAVLLDHNANGDARLTAYVKTNNGQAPSDLQAFAAAHLPTQAAVPAIVVALGEIPRLPNGKVDHDALRRIGGGGPERTACPPQTPAEHRLARLWNALLGIEHIGREDDFMALGGNSLLAARLVARIGEEFGCRLNLRTLFERTQLAAMAAAIDAAGPDCPSDSAPALLAPLTRTRFPLSPAQERLWFYEQFAPGSAAYNIPLIIRLKGPLDPAALARAFETTLARHEPLRTVYRHDEGEPYQEVLPKAPFVLEIRAVENEAEARHLATRFVYEPFELEENVFRARLYAISPEDHLMAVAMHHIVSDGWSLPILRREMAACYAAAREERAPQLEPLPLRYGDYCLREQARQGSPELADQLAFWREHLAGLEPLDLPLDYPRPAVLGHEGGCVTVETGPSLRDGVMHLGEQSQATPFMLLLAVFEALIAAWSGQSVFGVATGVAGRRSVDVEPLIGLFVNTVVLRADMGVRLPFRDMLVRVRQSAIEALSRQDVPFEKVVQALQPERDTARAPLAQVLFIVQNAPRATAGQWGGGLVAEETLPSAFATRLDIECHVFEEKEGLRIHFVYNAHLFRRETIEQLATNYLALFASAAAYPEEPLAVSSPRRGPAASGEASSVEAETGGRTASSPCRPPSDAALEAEAILSGIWQELLGVDPVGAGSHFFALGGDSLGCIRMVSKAAKAGLTVEVRDVFAHPVLRDLSTFIASRKGAGLVPGEQGRLEGEAPLLPIQRWFFDQPLPNPRHFNQAVVLRVSGVLNPDRLRTALRHLADHHDALRLRFARSGNGAWRQRYEARAEASEVLLDEIVLNGPAPRRREAQFADVAAHLHGELDFESGPMLRAALVRGFADGHDRLLLVAHHLAVDVVSWGILIEDLEELCAKLEAGQPVALPPKTGSYRAWGQRLERYAQDEAAEDRAWWRSHLAEAECPFAERAKRPPRPGPVEKLTRPLRVGTPGPTIEMLLTAWAMAVRTVTGSACAPLWFESHGRGIQFPGMDLSHTAGWFTSRYPLVLRLPETAQDAAAALDVIGRQWREAPNEGLSYGALRYLDPSSEEALSALASADRFETAFNYVGHIDPPLDGSRRLLIEERDAGSWNAAENAPPDGLAVTARITSGVLYTDIAFDRGRFAPRLMKRLLNEYAGAVQALLKEAGGNGGDAARTVVVLNGQGSHTPVFCLPALGNMLLSYYALTHLLGREQPVYGLQDTAFLTGAPALTTVEAMAEHFLAGMRVQQPHGPYRVFGWSFGAYTAFEIARRLEQEGERAHVIMLDPVPLTTVRNMPKMGPALIQALAIFVFHHISGITTSLDGLYALAAAERVQARAAGRAKSADGWRGFLRRMLLEALMRTVLPFSRMAHVIKEDELFAWIPQPRVPEFLDTLRVNSKAVTMYDPGPIEGPVTILLCERGVRRTVSEDYIREFWAGLTRGNLAVHHVPGDHLSVIQQPQVAEVARTMTEAFRNETFG